MIALADRICIARRFQRSIRIDTDLGDPHALEGFVCPRSSADLLTTMARHVEETGQGAFTWTGPYGSGKSSLVVALGALLNGNEDLRNKAAKTLGADLADAIWSGLPTGSKGWRIVPVVGRRDDPIKAIGDAITAAGLISRKPRGGWTEAKLIETLCEVATSRRSGYGGLVLFIDEMGKFLEAAAHDSSDIYIFQQLAEAASRSAGRLVLVGVLHQAFEEYAHRLSHQVQDEWAKIQGRFVDLAVNTAGDEQIELISRAIESDWSRKEPSNESLLVAGLIHGERRGSSKELAVRLDSCWPLHPVVAGLLGPISRRRFGQNQRSIFGFLNSSEPYGFQDYLRRATGEQLYAPDRLWDYLRASLEPAILASPDGHRWALAAEAMERCESMGGDAVHMALLKTIAVIDLFKERSGIAPSVSLLKACLPVTASRDIEKALVDLQNWSLVIFKKYLGAYAIFAGSDFDVEAALRDSMDTFEDIDFGALRSAAALQPLLAKRHYHDTGTLRWFELDLAPVSELVETAAERQPKGGAVGRFLLAVPTQGESEEVAAERCREAARQSGEWDVVAGVSPRSWALVTLARELIALDRIRNERSELAGDAVARREVAARFASLQGQIEGELRRCFDTATWYRKYQKQARSYRHADLNALASDLADRRFDQGPRLNNELLNRQKPSSNAVAARNELLKRMVLSEGQERLGIEGFPAEGGLFTSLLEFTGLYRHSKKKGWHFADPRKLGEDSANLAPLWADAIDYVKSNLDRPVPVSEIQEIWRKSPFGVKDGLLAVLSVAFLLSQRDGLAIYREGVFRARFDDVDVQYLAKDPAIIQLRWMDLSEMSRKLLSGMADIVRRLDSANDLAHLEPIDVARGLVAVFERLPPWTKRTMRLSANAVDVRELFKRAHDPNRFLFDDIPRLTGDGTDLTDDKALRRVVSTVGEGLQELVEAYPSMLHRLRDLMLAELEVPNLSPTALAELRERATNIRQLAGDFHLEAFVGRLSQFDGTDEAFQGIASLAASKPPRDWVDPDLDRAAIEVAEMAQKFLRAETFARVKGRPEKRHAMAIVVGTSGHPVPLLEEFHISDSDRVEVESLIDRVSAALKESDAKRRSIILAALAEVTAGYIGDRTEGEQAKTKRVAG